MTTNQTTDEQRDYEFPGDFVGPAIIVQTPKERGDKIVCAHGVPTHFACLYCDANRR